MSLKFLSIIFIMLVGQRSFGLVGDPNLIKNSVPESACWISVVNWDGGFSYACSGTLIASDKVLTAAHCMDRDFKVMTRPFMSIQCGYKGFDSNKMKSLSISEGINVFTEGAIFREKAGALNAEIDRFDKNIPSTHRFDEAVIFLDKKMKITPAKVDTNTNLPEGTQCLIASFGMDNSGQIGLPHTAAITLRSWNIENSVITKYGNIQLDEVGKKFFDKIVATYSLPDNAYLIHLQNSLHFGPQLKGVVMSTEGDSGGAVMCKRPGESDYSLLAIPSQYGTNLANENPPNGVFNLSLHAKFIIIDPTFLAPLSK